MTDSERPDHYSYTLYADPATARAFDEKRFGGPIGELVASTQARVIGDFLGSVQGRRILDVGTGTGRAAFVLTRAGAQVTGVDSSDEMLSVARRRAAEDGLDVTFSRGDAHALEYPDRSFDAVVSLRVLMHTPRWRQCVAELCRVADNLVVLDYPSAYSAAALEAVGRRIMAGVGLKTEPYRVLASGPLYTALKRSGFRVRAVHRQFVLPITLHKTLGSRRLTTQVEGFLGKTGALRLFGSPITLVAERCRTS